jgi:hypothetical protein
LQQVADRDLKISSMHIASVRLTHAQIDGRLTFVR